MNANPRSRLLHLILIAALAIVPLGVMAQNHSDIWWNPAEAGRGLVVIDHESDLFVAWCTYDPTGSSTWYVIPGGRLSEDHRRFEGTLYQARLPDPDSFASMVALPVGTAAIDFVPGNVAAASARFSIKWSSGAQLAETHELVRQPFGSAAPQWGTDATDLWWDPKQPGWGLAVVQHGDALFALYLTYDYTGEPAFYPIPARRTAGVVTAHPHESQFDGEIYSINAGRATFDPRTLGVQRLAAATLNFWGDATASPDRMQLMLLQPHATALGLSRMPFGSPKKDALERISP